jgi:hypothetical protein
MDSLTHTLTQNEGEPAPDVEVVDHPTSLAEVYVRYATRVYRYLLYRVRNPK